MLLKYKDKILKLAAAMMLFAVAGCGDGVTEAVQVRAAPEVVIEEVASQQAVITSILPGRTSAFAGAEVSPQVSGIILERLFEEGNEVVAGQPLYSIDSALYDAALKNAEASLSRAQGNAVAAANRAKRFAALVTVNAVSRQDYDDAVAAAKQARAAIAAAQAEFDSAKINLDRTTITAPIDGRIGRSFVTDGALVTAGQVQELAVIYALDPIYVDVAQSSAEILRWKRMREQGELATTAEDSLGVTLMLEDGGVYKEKGRLALTEVSVDPSTGSVGLRAIFPNPDNLLLPGMFVRAEIIEGVRESAMLVSQKAVTRNQQGAGVAYIVNSENRAEQRIVRTEQAVGARWLVADGLEPGERVIVEGFQKFHSGDVVTPIRLDRTAAAAASAGAKGDILSQ